MKSTLIAFASLLAVFATAQDSMKPSLYTRLGGLKGIAAVTDEFVNRLLSEPKIIGNPKVVAASKHITGPGLKVLLIEQLCDAAGGPQKYTGRDMLAAHKGVGVDEDQWNAGAQILKKTLDSFIVPNEEQQELFAVVGSTKKDIVKEPEMAKTEMADPHPITAMGKEGSAYNRVGGVHQIAATVDKVVDLCMKDEAVASDMAVKSSVDALGIAGVKFVFTEYFCVKLGGPQGIPGTMAELAPFGKKAGEAARKATAMHLKEVLDANKVPQEDQDAIFKAASEFLN